MTQILMFFEYFYRLTHFLICYSKNQFIIIDFNADFLHC